MDLGVGGLKSGAPGQSLYFPFDNKGLPGYTRSIYITYYVYHTLYYTRTILQNKVQMPFYKNFLSEKVCNKQK